MALIVEDGTGKLDAESYVSVDDHRAYCLKYGLTPDADDSIVEISLRKATDYMVSLYRGKLQGHRSIYNQALDFPRYDVWRDDYDLIPDDVVPAEVKACCSELAVIAETTALQSSSASRTKKMVKVGPLTVEYDGDGHQEPVFIKAVSRMAVFLQSGSNGFTAKLVRS